MTSPDLPPAAGGAVSRFLAEARAGHDSAVGRLLEAARLYLLLVANRELPPDLRPKVGPSDLVQETLLRAHRHFGQFRGATEDELLAWLRQILAENRLYVNTVTAAAHGLADGEWAWLESPHGRLRCRIRTMEGVEPSTVWTWNAIGKQRGAWALDHDAPEATTGFLLNHLIAEHLPRAAGDGARRLTNSDPVTGQAAWYDVRVRLTRCAHQHDGSEPRFEALTPTSIRPFAPSGWSQSPDNA